MPKPAAQITAAEISRLAGVTRATVSNWRRRHTDFPAPAGGTDASPLYDLPAVRAWLTARGHSAAASPAEELRTVLRLQPGASAVPRLLPLVLAAAQHGKAELDALSDLPDTELAAHAHQAVGTLARTIPDADIVDYTATDAPLLRALLHCIRDETPQAALDVLAERELEDSAASGAYQTPEPLADLMARLLMPETVRYPARVLDPACGSGSLLAAAARHGATRLHGQDLVSVQAQRSAVRLGLSAPKTEVTIRRGDTLRADVFPGLTADAALCNPPFGIRDWGHDELAYDERWAYGVPPKSESELAWAQHCLAHLAPGGHAVLLMPPAAAERPAGRRIRAQLVRDGALRAVIALPQGAATPLHIGLHLWVLQRPDPDREPPPTVLFVDTAATHPAATGETVLDWDALSSTVLTAWHAHQAGKPVELPGTARHVPLIDLLDEAVDLTPARHTRTAPTATAPAHLAAEAQERQDRTRRAATALAAISGGSSWLPAGEQPLGWRTATVADLLRGNALTLLQTAPPSRRPRSGQPTPSPENHHTGRPVLTAQDITDNRPASGASSDAPADSALVQQGDVLLPEVLRDQHSPAVRVAAPGDEGSLLGPHLLLLRPDPRRLDPWFLAGFLAAEQNLNAAATGSSIRRIDPKRLRVPLLPLTEQRRYGTAFQHLHALRDAARQAADLAAEAADLLTAGLTGGALLPPRTDSPDTATSTPGIDHTGPLRPEPAGS